MDRWRFSTACAIEVLETANTPASIENGIVAYHRLDRKVLETPGTAIILCGVGWLVEQVAAPPLRILQEYFLGLLDSPLLFSTRRVVDLLL